MPCNPIDPGDILLPPTPPGFNGNFVPSLPDLNIPFPPLPIEDLFDLFDRLSLILPSGILRPHLSPQFSKNPLDALLSLLEKFYPFLMVYTFFMPILNLILCIIEVLCAIPHVPKLIRALKRLFRTCIPEFLALFPFFAIILMIISLLLLILTIILYIIERILAFIRQIIENIKLLVEAVESNDADSIIAIITKLGDLLCILQNLFVLFGVIALIFQIVEKLLNLDFRIPPCDDADSSADGCCTADVCPSFIKNNTTIASATGTIQYFNYLGLDSGLILPPSFPQVSNQIRPESWQFFDGYSAEDKAFSNITNAFDLPPGVSKIFFPEGEVYTGNTSINSVPYTVDVRFFYRPSVFGRLDLRGDRFIRIKNCILLRAPESGVTNYEGIKIAPFNGTCSLEGGTAYEDDGKTIFNPNGGDGAGTLNTVIKLPAVINNNPVPMPTDGVRIDNVQYEFKINHAILAAKSLITIGCQPDFAIDKNFLNDTIGAQGNINRIALQQITTNPPGAGGLPDIAGAQECIISAITEYRKNVSLDSTQLLQDKLLACLNKLQNEVSSCLEAVINAGFDPYASTFVLEPSIQFTTRDIKVKVNINESSGNSITSNIPAEIASSLSNKITSVITLGEITPFEYDGYSQFVANISSQVPGNGTIKIAFDNKFISILDNPTDVTLLPSVKVKELTYTFVQSAGLPEGLLDRTESDVASQGA